MVENIQDLDFNKTYSYQDYLTWKFQETVELIKGKIFPMSPAPNLNHQEVSSNLHAIFYNYLKKKNCKVFSAPFDVRLSSDHNDINTVVQPDLCVVCDLTKLDRRGCKGAPDLVIEILSKNNVRHDTHDKLVLYEEAQVPEYWIVHPQDMTLLVFLLNEKGEYETSRPFTKGDFVTPSMFPDLKVDLEEVFDILDV